MIPVVVVPRFAPTLMVTLTMTMINSEDGNDNGNDNDNDDNNILVKSNVTSTHCDRIATLQG